MSKIKISIAMVGHMPLDFDARRIKSWKSDLFTIDCEIESYALTSDSDGDNWEFTDENLEKTLPKSFSGDFLIALVNVPIEMNWYSRRLTNNRVVFTFHEMREILNHSNIPLENVIYRLLYAYTLVFKRNNGSIPTNAEATNFTHDETRGCLFDMNGIKTDVIYSCHEPRICPDCVERLRNSRVSNNIIKTVQDEIKKIRKPLFYRVLDFIKKHPIWSLAISGSTAVILGAFGSYISTVIYVAINGNV